MNFHWSLFKPRVPYEHELIAGLRDQIIELGTHVRFLEADRLTPQPRGKDGRFASTKPDRRAELEAIVPSDKSKRDAFIATAKNGGRG